MKKREIENLTEVQESATANCKSKIAGETANQIKDALEQLSTKEPPKETSCTVGEFMQVNADLLIALTEKGYSVDTIKGAFEAAGVAITKKSLQVNLKKLKQKKETQAQEMPVQEHEEPQSNESDTLPQNPEEVDFNIAEEPDDQSSEIAGVEKSSEPETEEIVPAASEDTVIPPEKTPTPRSVADDFRAEGERGIIPL